MTLAESLARHTQASTLCTVRETGQVVCEACGHRCPLSDGAVGVCRVRYNRHGQLMVPWGYVAGTQCDPIEKKPFFHAWPGSMAYSFGMLGCDLHCGYCQNWVTSQALRDPRAVAPFLEVEPEALVADAVARGASCVVSTYNEPLITAEWTTAIFERARSAGLATGIVSNGHGTPQVVERLAPWLTLCKIDLKSCREARYRELGGRLGPVLETIREVQARGIWLEVVTLLVPGFNDDEAELGQIAAFLASVSVDIPWHVTAFHGEYRMWATADTTPTQLERAVAVGRASGLRFVYAGNRPGRVGGLEDTHCPHCQTRLVGRRGYHILEHTIGSDGRCPRCGLAVPGRWGHL